MNVIKWSNTYRLEQKPTAWRPMRSVMQTPRHAHHWLSQEAVDVSVIIFNLYRSLFHDASVTHTIYRRMIGWQRIINCKGYARKQSLCNFKYYPSICLEWLRKTIVCLNSYVFLVCVYDVPLCTLVGIYRLEINLLLASEDGGSIFLRNVS
jgi:hypothetical protein